MDVEPGVETSRIVTFSMTLPAAKYHYPPMEKYPNWPEAVQFVDMLTERAKAIPGVQSVAVGAHHPLHDGFSSQLEVIGAPKKEGSAGHTPRPAKPASRRHPHRAAGAQVLPERRSDRPASRFLGREADHCRRDQRGALRRTGQRDRAGPLRSDPADSAGLPHVDRAHE